MKLEVYFGAMADPIRKQVPQLSKSDASRFQLIADAITTLKIHGFMPNGAATKARLKLINHIGRKVSARPEKG